MGMRGEERRRRRLWWRLRLGGGSDDGEHGEEQMAVAAEGEEAEMAKRSVRVGLTHGRGEGQNENTLT